MVGIQSTFLMKRSSIFFFLMFFVPLAANAEDTLEINSPKEVRKDEIFEIRVTQKNSFDEINIQGNNFEFLGQRVMSVSKTLVQGRFSETRTYTYKLKPMNSGPIHLTIQSGSVKKKVKILSVDPPKVSIPSKDLTEQSKKKKSSVIVLNRLSKQKLLVNETAVMETVLYSKIEVGSQQLINRYNQNCYQLISVDSPKVKKKIVTLNGRKFSSQVIFKYIIFGQKTGTCTIESMPLRFNVIKPGFLSIRKSITVSIPSISFEVINYPPKQKPAGFNSQYGNFDIFMDISSTKTQKKSPVRLSISISGNGNFIALNEPKFLNVSPFLSVTKDNVIDSYFSLGETLSGNKTFNYYLTPLKSGTIKNTATVVFSFYSPVTQSYRTEKIKLPTLKVSPILLSASDVPSEGVSPEKTPDNQEPLHPIIERETSPYEWTPRIMIWYHLLGVFSFALVLGIHRRENPAVTDSIVYSLKDFLRLLEEIKKLAKNGNKNREIYSFSGTSSWVMLKNKTSSFIEKLYHFNSAKSWNKEMSRLLNKKTKKSPTKLPSLNSDQEKNSSLTSKEMDSLAILSKKIRYWEEKIYQEGENLPQNDTFDYDREVEETADILSQILSEKVLQDKPKKLWIKKFLPNSTYPTT